MYNEASTHFIWKKENQPIQNYSFSPYPVLNSKIFYIIMTKVKTTTGLVQIIH